MKTFLRDFSVLCVGLIFGLTVSAFASSLSDNLSSNVRVSSLISSFDSVYSSSGDTDPVPCASMPYGCISPIVYPNAKN